MSKSRTYERTGPRTFGSLVVCSVEVSSASTVGDGLTGSEVLAGHMISTTPPPLRTLVSKTFYASTRIGT